jgi:predicted lipoprotein with Yx(FWY)xxD motif
MKRLRIPVAALVVALAVAACGGSTSTNSSASSRAKNTVAVSRVDGIGKVLVDSRGMALYSSNLDAPGKPACTGACTSFWKPLTLASGTPSAAAGAGKIGVVMRPDGMRQVAVGGKPLYTFVQDSPGKVSGNGFSDAFSGRHFTWTAILAGGGKAAPGASGTGTTTAGGGYSGAGGY